METVTEELQARNAIQARVLREVAIERRRQDELHKDSNCSNRAISTGRKFIILGEEVGEVSKECCDLTGPPWPRLEQIPEIKARLKTELIQVAAVAVAWAESLEVE